MSGNEFAIIVFVVIIAVILWREIHNNSKNIEKYRSNYYQELTKLREDVKKTVEERISKTNERISKLNDHVNPCTLEGYPYYRTSRIDVLEEKFNNLPETKAKKAQEKIEEAQKIIDSIGE